MARKRKPKPVEYLPNDSPWIDSGEKQYVRVCPYGFYTIDFRQEPISIAFMARTEGRQTIRYTRAENIAEAMQTCEREVGEFGLGHQLLMDAQV